MRCRSSLKRLQCCIAKDVSVMQASDIYVCSRDAQEKVCCMLDGLLSRLLTAEGVAILGPLLQSIIFALAECIDSDFKTVSHMTQSNAVAGLIEKLVIGVSNLKSLLLDRSLISHAMLFCPTLVRVLAYLFCSPTQYTSSALCRQFRLSQ